MTIKVTYNVTDVYMSQSVSPVYINVSYSDGGASGGGVWGSITGTLSNQTDLQTALDAKLDESTIDGGTEGQILSKASATDFDFAWINNYAKYLATNVRNQSGSTIGAFQVVYISGATGNKPLISLADADTEATSSKTYGVTATAIANNGTGDVVTAGELSGINTSAFNEGDLLWLSTTAGGVVTSPPVEPAHSVFIGYVVRSHPTLGVIDVSIQNGYELNELHGVQITSAANNDGLFYNATSTLWENKSIATALGYTPVPTTRNITINGVTYDLSADRTWTIAAGISGSGAAGQVTYWTGASAVSGSNNLFWDNANGRLGIGTNAPVNDITINKSFDGQVRLRIENTSTGGNALTDIYVRNSTGGATFQVTGTGNTIPNVTANQARFRTDSAVTNGFTFLTGTTAPITFGTNDIVGMTMFGSTRNVGIGFTTDLAVRLGVSGDTLLRGSGATSATTALTVQNSDLSALLKVDNSGSIYIGNAGSRTPYIAPYSDATTQSLTGRAIGFVSTVGPNAAVPAFIFTATSLTATSGAGRFVEISPTYSPTSGTGTLALLAIQATINQTGGANGITRGLYVNPTLTSAADFRAIETTAGNVLFGSNFFWDNANGRLGIGTNAPAFRLDLIGNETVNPIFNVVNNASSPSYIPIFETNAPNINVGAAVYFAIGRNRTNNNQASLNFHYAGNGSTLNRLDVGFYGTLPRISVTAGGNILLGTTSDLGVRLGVVGDTLLRGSGATSATTALTVQNSSSTNLFRVRNDGNAFIDTTASFGGLTIVNTNAVGNSASRLTVQANTSAVSFFNHYNSNAGLGLANNGGFGSDNSIVIFSDATLQNGGTNSIQFRTGGYETTQERLRIKPNGQVRFVPLASAPASPEAGDVYYNSTDNKHYGYNGTTWNAFY